MKGGAEQGGEKNRIGREGMGGEKKNKMHCGS